MFDEGYIKFHCHWIQAEPIPPSELEEINHWRNHLYDLGLIGVYQNGVGFGNISIRATKSAGFIISGTQTGNLPILSEQHYTRVIDFDLAKNSLTCEGPVRASSESLTHAILYQTCAEANAVIHIHHPKLWNQLLDQVPTSSREVPYGTPEMAKEVTRLFADSDLQAKKILVMGGHQDGVVTFGENLDEAATILFAYLGKLESGKFKEGPALA